MIGQILLVPRHCGRYNEPTIPELELCELTYPQRCLQPREACEQSPLCTDGRLRINRLTSNVPYAVRFVLRNDVMGIIFLLLFILSSSLAFSQSDTVTLPDVEIIEHREMLETGTSVVKLDKMILKVKELSSLSEVLSENTSVFVKTYGRGSLSTASFRGTTASHTKVSWNNVSLSSPMLGMVDMSLVPMSIADEVNVFCGSASMQKSETAIGGVVEINTRPMWDRGVSAKIVSSVASFHTFDNMAQVRAGTEKFQSVTKFYDTRSRNDFKFKNSDIAGGGIQKRENADYRMMGAIQELYFRTTERSFLSLKFWWQNYDRGVPGLTTNESGLLNNKNRQDGNSFVSSLSYRFYTEKSKLDISVGDNYQLQNYLSQSYISGVGFYKIVNSDTKANSLYTTANYSYAFNDRLEISARLKYNFHTVASYDSITRNGYDTVRHDYGALVSLFGEPFKRFRCGVTLRQEFYDKSVCPFLPSLFLEYNFRHRWFVRSSLSKNYSVPTLNDLFYVPGGNPDLVPETAYVADISFGKKYNSLNGKFSISAEAGANYSHVKNWIMWCPTNRGYWQPINLEKVVAYGADAKLNTSFEFHDSCLISLTANYAYTHSTNLSTPRSENDMSIGKQLAYIPLHSANVFGRISAYGFYFFYQWNYFSERFTTSAEETGVLVSIYPYFMSDIGLGKEFVISDFAIDLNFKINNLFNESYRSVLWQPMPRINFAFQISVSYR